MQDMQETWFPSLGWEDPLEEGRATRSSILAWRLPWTEEPGGAMVHRVAKSWTRLRQLNTHQELAYARHCPCITSFNL